MNLITQLLMQIPSFLIALLGFVLAGIFLQRARTAALLVIIASILILAQSAFSMFNQLVLLERVMDGEMANDTYAFIASGGYMLFYIAISVLMLAAAFAGRSQPPLPQPVAADSLAATASASAQVPHRGGLILTLGLLGLLMFAPLGIVAWVLGNKDLSAMRQGSMDKNGEGMTLAGKVIGILATALMIFGIIVFLGAMAVLSSSHRGF